jgi:hypothetical protein
MTTSHSEIVSEEDVERCLDYLKNSADTIGKLTTEARFTESWVKVVLAMVMKTVEGPVNSQEREARASEEYQKALKAEAEAAGALARAKALREAAAMKIEVWRTQSSNWRSMKL